MSTLQTPFRYDYVGSFLRPERLKKARADFETGTIDQAQLKEVEDECILDLVSKIKGLGYHVITDGEFRRFTWHLDFIWGFHGIEHKKTVDGNTTFDGEAAMIDDTYMVGKISVKDHPFVEHFKFIKTLEDKNTVAKQTIPSPGQFYAYFTGAELLTATLDIYGTEEAFADDVVKAYSKYVNAYYLEYDDERSGGFAPLAKVSGNKKVVLGLVTTKTPALENKEAFIARIHEAAKYIPLDRLYLSPQCGFASCEIGNKLTEEEQWAKPGLVKEIAEEVWGH